MDQLLLFRLTRAEVDYDRQERTCYRFVCTHVGCRSQAAVVISTNGQVITRIDESVHNHDLLAGCVNQITEFTDEALANWLDDGTVSLKYKPFFFSSTSYTVFLPKLASRPTTSPSPGSSSDYPTTSSHRGGAGHCLSGSRSATSSKGRQWRVPDSTNFLNFQIF